MSRPKNSGRPAGRAGREPQPATGSLSPKQQRAADIQQKLAGYKAQHRRQRRNRLILIVTAWTAAAALVAGLVVFAVTSTTPKAPPAAIEGVQTFSGLSANHVNGPVKYPQAPPAGGDHSPVPLNCAVYTEPVPGENAVHSLEHGAVWMAYDPQSVSDEELKQLREEIPSTYMISRPTMAFLPLSSYPPGALNSGPRALMIRGYGTSFRNTGAQIPPRNPTRPAQEDWTARARSIRGTAAKALSGRQEQTASFKDRAEP